MFSEGMLKSSRPWNLENLLGHAIHFFFSRNSMPHAQKTYIFCILNFNYFKKKQAHKIHLLTLLVFSISWIRSPAKENVPDFSYFWIFDPIQYLYIFNLTLIHKHLASTEYFIITKFLKVLNWIKFTFIKRKFKQTKGVADNSITLKVLRNDYCETSELKSSK